MGEGVCVPAEGKGCARGARCFVTVLCECRWSTVWKQLWVLEFCLISKKMFVFFFFKFIFYTTRASKLVVGNFQLYKPSGETFKRCPDFSCEPGCCRRL